MGRELVSTQSIVFICSVVSISVVRDYVDQVVSACRVDAKDDAVDITVSKVVECLGDYYNAKQLV